ncbi:potassium channel family protein [Actinotalea sp. K2]|uniref:potassium channel family protein n=1 Tax=Actinotalea sp. K2 TaxID=2939438 RepID=UPI0020175104|nr:potassium channel family protein [Actinotalea sp. K2]MCL3862380.1 potassium channel family protein [Actinotalea sp. K2]
MHWIWALLGSVVIVVVLRDVFATLWHPAGRGSVASVVLRTGWRLSRRVARDDAPSRVTGPAGMVAVVLIWFTGAIVGWALIYWPRIDRFAYSSQVDARDGDLLDALYVSMVSLATLGLGDVVPVEPWVRLVVPGQALTGFALLSAAVTWILQIYPALTRRRTLAERMRTLEAADVREELRLIDAPSAAALVHGLAEHVAVIRVDLGQLPESYYFRETDPRQALAETFGSLWALADVASTDERPGVRFAGAVLRSGIEELACVLAVGFLDMGDAPGVDEVASAFRADHGWG